MATTITFSTPRPGLYFVRTQQGRSRFATLREALDYMASIAGSHAVADLMARWMNS